MPDGSDRHHQRVCDVPWRHLMTREFHEVIWPQIEPFLAAALATDEMGRYTAADVLQAMMLGTVRLWVSYDVESKQFEMAATTQIIQSPRCRECRVWLVGGRNMKAWRDEFMGQTESYARAEGCRYLTGAGMRAWSRAAPGYHTAGFNLVKKLY